jgi:hypothetical protein
VIWAQSFQHLRATFAMRRCGGALAKSLCHFPRSHIISHQASFSLISHCFTFGAVIGRAAAQMLWPWSPSFPSPSPSVSRIHSSVMSAQIIHVHTHCFSARHLIKLLHCGLALKLPTELPGQTQRPHYIFTHTKPRDDMHPHHQNLTTSTRQTGGNFLSTSTPTSNGQFHFES